MPLNDEQLEVLLKGANPAATPADAEPSTADWARLQRIVTQPPSTRRPVPRRPARIAIRAAWALPALAAVIAVGLSIGPMIATPAFANTPPPLVAQPIALSVEEVMGQSIARLNAEPATIASHDAQVVRWVLRDDGKDDPVIVPEWQKWVWDSDGTGHLEATTGAPYSVTADGKIVAPVGKAPAAGTPVEVAPPSVPVKFRTTPPADVNGLRAYLERYAGLSEGADALAIWGAISTLRDEWTLSPAQQAAALQLLRQSGGMSVLGTVTDRLGRQGIAVKVTSTNRPQFAATVVVGAESGEIIAADITYLGGSHQPLDVAPGAVIGYKAWLSR